jgi:hypothetical protein
VWDRKRERERERERERDKMVIIRVCVCISFYTFRAFAILRKKEGERGKEVQ